MGLKLQQWNGFWSSVLLGERENQTRFFKFCTKRNFIYSLSLTFHLSLSLPTSRDSQFIHVFSFNVLLCVCLSCFTIILLYIKFKGGRHSSPFFNISFPVLGSKSFLHTFQQRLKLNGKETICPPAPLNTLGRGSHSHSSARFTITLFNLHVIRSFNSLAFIPFRII